MLHPLRTNSTGRRRPWLPQGVSHAAQAGFGSGRAREVSVVQACREAGWCRSRFYELRARYHAYGEAGLLPKPRPPARYDRHLRTPGEGQPGGDGPGSLRDGVGNDLVNRRSGESVGLST